MNAETADSSDTVPAGTLPFWFSFSSDEATLGAEFKFSTIAAYDIIQSRLTYSNIFSMQHIEQPRKISMQNKAQYERKRLESRNSPR